MQHLLDGNGNLNIVKLDRIVDLFYQNRDKNAEKVLIEFKKHPQTWKKIPLICSKSSSTYTKFLSIDILRDVVKFKWGVMPEVEKRGMKNFIVKSIIKLCGENLKSPLLTRYNLVLVEIIKKQWPQYWKSVIPELIKSASSNEKYCENHMSVFKILSEDIFEFAEGTMTHKKKDTLKKSLLNEFQEIFKLCQMVFNKSKKESLIKATLKCLSNYLKWIPIGWIFETNLLGFLTQKFMGTVNNVDNFRVYRNEVVKCLIQISNVETVKYSNKMAAMFNNFMNVCVKKMSPNTNFQSIYNNLSHRDQIYINSFTLFLKTILSKYLKLFEKDSTLILITHKYLINISKVDGDKELFKICLDYWNYFVKDLYEEEKKKKDALMLTSYNNQRKMLYKSILDELRHIIIMKMAKPEEVIIVEDQNGELIKEHLKDVDKIQMHKTMKYTLIFLAHLDYKAVQSILKTKLRNQLNNSKEFSWKKLNSLCWSIGTLNGVMSKNQESMFVVIVVRDLLELCKIKTGKENKAVIAANIMYVCQKYPRFLTCNWGFLKTVVMKLFDFMHESFQGVQEMACETFLKITKETKSSFVKVQKKERNPFLIDILRNISSIISDLRGRDIYVFFEAMGVLIDASPSDKHKELMAQLMKLPNLKFKEIISSGNQNTQSLKNIDTIEQLKNLLKTNSYVARSATNSYVFQMRIIYEDIVKTYKFYSNEMSCSIKAKGEGIINHFYIKKMSAAKSEILNLFEMFISSPNLNLQLRGLIYSSFLSKFLSVVLSDFCQSIPQTRDAKILSLISIVIQWYSGNLVEVLPEILEKVFKYTLPLITGNMNTYLELRLNLFKLIRSINKNSFSTFFKIPAQGFKTVMKCILWAIKHKERNNYEEGLNILNELIENLKKLKHEKKIINSFFRNYYILILNDVFYVITDLFHQTLINIQCNILQNLFFVISFDVVTVQLTNNTDNNNNSINRNFPPNNKIFLRDYFANLLAKHFNNLTKNQIGKFIVALFKYSNDRKNFAKTITDFLVQMREYTNVVSYNQFFEKRNLAIEYKQNQQSSIPSLPPPVSSSNNNQNNMIMSDQDMDDEPLSITHPSMMNNNNNNNNRQLDDELLDDDEEDDKILAITQY